MSTLQSHGRGQSVTLWLPADIATQLDQVLSRQVTSAALRGQIGRGLPNRHAFILAAVRAALGTDQNTAVVTARPGTSEGAAEIDKLITEL